MHTIKTTSGALITLDGDLLAVMEALFREVTARRGLERSFEDMVNRLSKYSPMLFLLVFAVAGKFLWPVAETITSKFLMLVMRT